MRLVWSGWVLLILMVLSLGCLNEQAQIQTTEPPQTTIAPQTTVPPTTLPPTTAPPTAAQSSTPPPIIQAIKTPPPTTPPPPEAEIVIIKMNSYVKNGPPWLTAVGEVENVGAGNTNWFNIDCTFYDEGGNKIDDSDITYIDLSRLRPGQRSPFKVYSYTLKRGFNTIEAECKPRWGSTYSEPYDYFEINNPTGYPDHDGNFVVEGEIKNIGDKKVNSQIAGAFYESEGTVQAVDSTIVYSLNPRERVSPSK